MKIQDPTRDEMLDVINDYPYRSEVDKFDVEGAIYWFACNYHGGQWSNLYSALSTSEFRPGPTTNGPEDGFEQELYDLLIDTFAPETRRDDNTTTTN